ncbi:MAG: YbaK/EbsC family protein [Firmicutes bacterium]|nr:YbaK/EbsC family protein [Bacillota bacterium]
MSIESVRRFLQERGYTEPIMEMPQSSATVALAAAALGVEECRIAKTLSFADGEGAMVIVVAGDARLNNAKFKRRFGFKPRMLPTDQVAGLTGHPVGGVCPFALRRTIPVYLDVSLRRFDVVFPAAGGTNTAVRMTPEQLEKTSGGEWVDVCRVPGEEDAAS